MNKEQLMAYLKAIWPTVYRIINGTFYFLINLIKSSVRMIINQLKGRY